MLDDLGRHGSKLTGRLQAGTANKETVNILLLGELTAVLLTDGATVDNTDIGLGLGGDAGTEPLADSGVDLLGLLGGSDLAGTDSPRCRLELYPIGSTGSRKDQLTRRARRR